MALQPCQNPLANRTKVTNLDRQYLANNRHNNHVPFQRAKLGGTFHGFKLATKFVWFPFCFSNVCGFGSICWCVKKRILFILFKLTHTHTFEHLKWKKKISFPKEKGEKNPPTRRGQTRWFFYIFHFPPARNSIFYVNNPIELHRNGHPNDQHHRQTTKFKARESI